MAGRNTNLNETERRKLISLEFVRCQKEIRRETIDGVKETIMAEISKTIDLLLGQIDENTGIGVLRETIGYGQTITIVPILKDGRLASDAADARKSELTDLWRVAVYRRDKFACQKCGSKKHIQAHHKKSWKKAPSERFNLDNGITLCAQCHSEEHPEIANLIKGQSKCKPKSRKNKPRNK